MSDAIVGLDIGTSFVRAVLGEFTEENKLEITGVGKVQSKGIRNGVIVNLETTMQAVTEAVEAAEQMSGHEVRSVVTGIGGSQIESQNSRGVVAVADRGKGTREITSDDVSRVIDAARAVPVPPDRQVLHVVPQTYTIDGQPGIKDPINEIGVRLEADVHIVTAAVTTMQNMIRCVGRAGYEVDGVMLKTLASSEAVTTEEERDLGSILIDMGGGSTDALVLIDGSPICTASIPIGGNLVTNDISIIKSVSFDIAEQVKLKSGCCNMELIESDDETVIIPGIGGRAPSTMPRKELCEIIRPRIVETFVTLRDKLAVGVQNRQLMGNVILIGGGALLPGVVDVASEVFGTRAVRLGMPGNFGGLQDEYRNPEYATAVGLVVSNQDKRRSEILKNEKEKKQPGFSRLKGFFKEFF